MHLERVKGYNEILGDHLGTQFSESTFKTQVRSFCVSVERGKTRIQNSIKITIAFSMWVSNDL